MRGWTAIGPAQLYPTRDASGARREHGGTASLREDGEISLYTPDVPATIGGLLAATEALHVEPADLMVRRATLEDVFLDLTGRALRD